MARVSLSQLLLLGKHSDKNFYFTPLLPIGKINLTFNDNHVVHDDNDDDGDYDDGVSKNSDIDENKSNSKKSAASADDGGCGDGDNITMRVMRIVMMMTVMLMMVTQWDNEDENDNDVIVSTSLFAGDDNLPQCQTQLPETENCGGHRTAGVEQDGLQSCGCAEASLRLVAFDCPWWLSGFQSWTAAHAVVGSKPRRFSNAHGLFFLFFLYCY